jgi:hypothetical protein
MPIPDFTADGYLPPGVHGCTTGELRSRFGTFQRSDRRPRLFARLQHFLQEARQTGLIVAVVVDGSFVTAIDEPNDVDLLLLVRQSHDFTAALRPFEYNVLSSRQVRKRHGLDILVAAEGSAPAARFEAFFAGVRDVPGATKGLLRLTFGSD